MSMTVPLDPGSRDITDVPLPDAAGERPVLRDRRRTSLVTMARTGDPAVRDTSAVCAGPIVSRSFIRDLDIPAAAVRSPTRPAVRRLPARGGTAAAYDVAWARQRSADAVRRLR